jgi:basic membrane protein A
MTKYAPKAHLASVIEVWGGYYTKVAEDMLAGKPLKKAVWGGIKDGMNDLVSVSDSLPDAAKKMVADKKAAMAAGKFHVFSGPIKGQDGSIIVAAGKTLNDQEIDSIKWYVEGVEGQVPGGK